MNRTAGNLIFGAMAALLLAITIAYAQASAELEDVKKMTKTLFIINSELHMDVVMLEWQLEQPCLERTRGLKLKDRTF